MDNITVSFTRENIKCETNVGESLLKIAADNGISICRGGCYQGKCGGCRVIVTKGNDKCLTSQEKELLSDEEIIRGVRLACSYVPKEDVSVITLSGEQNSTLLVKKKRLNSGSDKDIKPVVVMDAGTTTLKLYVYDEADVRMFDENKTGDLIPVADMSMDNPLRLFGADVMTRINNAAESKRYEKMKSLLHEAIEKMLAVAAKDYKFDKFVIIGNTTMIHIAAGKEISRLGRAPFDTGYMGGQYITGYAFGSIDAYVAPCIKGHVGADALSCLYAMRSDGLIMDIGTNSELLLCSKGKIYVCSAPAGPAFEETNIGCGMKRDRGAVVNIKEAGDSFELFVDDGNDGLRRMNSLQEDCRIIRGLCAGAVIDLTACMLKKGIIDEFGTFARGISHMDISPFCPTVKFTQEDVRNLQLGKAAVIAGAAALMHKAQIDNEEKGCLYLAGNFGSGMDADNGILIGLLPDTKRDRILAMGNMAAKGAAVMFMRMLHLPEEKMDLYDPKNIIHVELTDDDYFKEMYIKEMNFGKNEIL